MSPHAKSHSRARVVILLALTFSAGLAVGVGGDRLIESGAPVTDDGLAAVRESETPRSRRSGIQPRFAIERHADELGLTEAQLAEIEPILLRVRTEMDTIMADIRPRFRAVYDSARLEIEQVLTPDQVARYREILEDRRGGHEGGERE